MLRSEVGDVKNCCHVELMAFTGGRIALHIEIEEAVDQYIAMIASVIDN